MQWHGILKADSFEGEIIGSCLWTGNGGTIYYTGGNVGIGTDSPFLSLSVVGNGTYTAGTGIPLADFADIASGINKRGIILGYVGNSLGTGADAGMIRVPNNANLVINPLGGNVGIGTITPTGKLHVVGLPIYANNAAAIAGGLTSGAFYRTNADPDPVCVVH